MNEAIALERAYTRKVLAVNVDPVEASKKLPGIKTYYYRGITFFLLSTFNSNNKMVPVEQPDEVTYYVNGERECKGCAKKLECMVGNSEEALCNKIPSDNNTNVLMGNRFSWRAQEASYIIKALNVVMQSPTKFKKGKGNASLDNIDFSKAKNDVWQDFNSRVTKFRSEVCVKCYVQSFCDDSNYYCFNQPYNAIILKDEKKNDFYKEVADFVNANWNTQRYLKNIRGEFKYVCKGKFCDIDKTNNFYIIPEYTWRSEFAYAVNPKKLFSSSDQELLKLYFSFIINGDCVLFSKTKIISSKNLGESIISSHDLERNSKEKFTSDWLRDRIFRHFFRSYFQE